MPRWGTKDSPIHSHRVAGSHLISLALWLDTMESHGPSKFVAILHIPSTWDQNLLTKKCSAYGFVDDVTIHRDRNIAIVEFEDESDAGDFVDDAASIGLQATLHYPSVASDTSSTTLTLNEGPFPCANPSCSHILMQVNREVFCTPKCYQSSSNPHKMNMYDKWVTSLGRSGSGLLKDLTKIDNLTISIDHRGLRSSTIIPRNAQGTNQPH